MSKYTSEYKLEVINSVLDDGMSFGEASEKYSVDKSDVRKWVAAYQIHGNSGIEKKRISYPGEFKQKVIEDIRDNKLSHRQAAAKYNLANHTTVAMWERIYLEEGLQGLYVERRGRAKSTLGERVDRSVMLDEKVAEDLIAENQRLRMENEYLKKLNALVQERKRSERKIKLR